MKQLFARMAFVVGILAAAPTSGAELLAIGGIAPGAKLPDITARFGPPISQEPSEGFIVLRVGYEGLSFGLDEDGLVAFARTTNPSHCFNGWLCPGMSLAQARERIPGLQPAASAPEDPFVAFNEGEGCWLELLASGGSVASLAIVCQP